MASRTKVTQRIAELGHEDVAVRRKAALKLGEYGDKSALPELCAALRDESWKVQRNAASALGSFRDPAAVEALASIFIERPRKKRYISVRKKALYALGQIGTEEAVDVIAPIWLKERDNIRLAAAEALFSCGLIAVPTICSALVEARSALRSRAPAILGAARLLLQSLPGQHEGNERSARDLLFRLIEEYHEAVFTTILATNRLTPQHKHICLELLHYRRRLLNLTIFFRDTRTYCEQLAATAAAAEVREGARAVLDYALLARGSDRPPEGQGDVLLRAAQASAGEAGNDELLRRSEEPDAELAETPTESEGLMARAMRLFKRR